MDLIFLFLLVVSIFGVIAIVRQIIGNRKHIEDNDIRKYRTNQLSERDRQRVISHLGICEDCRDRFVDLDGKQRLEDHLIDPNE